MILASLLLAAAAAPATAVDAERAFAADAQRQGQWTAFRKWAAPDAVMWTPQAVWAHDFLKGRKDPAQSVEWSPTHSWQSCDGRTAVNVGRWYLADGTGRWITLWMRQPSGTWRWTFDGQLEPGTGTVLPRRVAIRIASCANPRLRTARVAAEYAQPLNRTAPPGDSGYGRSADGTLLFNWTVAADGIRRTRVQLWTGRRFSLVHDEVTRP
ncbi:hypothetical protein [Sphingomonas sp. LHG3443-2]|uniref:hypothetical protein n=1 Tax=Sphingomonas sp. LHG3443-2 TaxID=2804639 RepID=UPI003CF0E94F